ncbi:CDP-glycerol glycerophosphotransferase (TagB/SpsB family) [Flavobacterium sp. 7E]|uniref:CDP-glycerol glycerophosphotransferase family protein n=1 Tax=Flavobacterium sp. 7E TaxID=2735898 RepID=UPI0020C656DA|nr:CDP-glycerol glycerophosphotransferase family protein [Flavobacterium sp. 7E]NRS89407.1 CDP-glycerol glycerophosphotransferase (TagB/SpsB family) [Flavobacterium sp. 7E]
MSDFIVEALDQFDSIVIYSGLPLNAYPIKLPSTVIIKELAVYKESKLTWFFRKWKEVAHLQKYKTFYGMNDALTSGYPKESSLRAILIKFIYLITQKIHSDTSIVFIEKLQFASFSSNKITKSYLKMLKEDAPSYVFFTHQRPSYLAPFLYATIKSKIAVSSFIFSWDNLSSKGRMLGTFDSFLVWSDLMKKELLYFYPKVKASKVKVVGTPQFEPYIMDKYQMDKEIFYTNFNLNKSKKIICYSCADSSIGANDALVIRSIIMAIRENNMNTTCQLLVRTSPAEGPARFDVLKNEFPEIIWNYPKWVLTRENHAESWSQRIPSDQDIKDLRAILQYADLNVNMCSTMSLDFMLFDKPVINTVFGNDENGLYDDQRFLNYDHYKKVIDSGAVTIATTKEELIAQINEALDKSSLRSQQRKNLVKLQISHDLKGTSKRIAQTLSDLNG